MNIENELREKHVGFQVREHVKVFTGPHAAQMKQAVLDRYLRHPPDAFDALLGAKVLALRQPASTNEPSRDPSDDLVIRLRLRSGVVLEVSESTESAERQVIRFRLNALGAGSWEDSQCQDLSALRQQLETTLTRMQRPDEESLNAAVRERVETMFAQLWAEIQNSVGETVEQCTSRRSWRFAAARQFVKKFAWRRKAVPPPGSLLAQIEHLSGAELEACLRDNHCLVLDVSASAGNAMVAPERDLEYRNNSERDAIYYQDGRVIVNEKLLQSWSKKSVIVRSARITEKVRALRGFQDLVLSSAAKFDELFVNSCRHGRGEEEQLRMADPAWFVEKGRAWLQEKFGVPTDGWFVTVYCRESSDTASAHGRSCCTADIATYELAIQEITRRGGWVFRLGEPDMKPLPPMERVIDYAHAGDKEAWVGHILLHHCRFYLGTGSGPSAGPSVFQVPQVTVNHVPTAYGEWPAQDLWLPKLYRRKADGRLLTIEESPLTSLHAWTADDFEEAGLELVNNTAEEIHHACVEMLERLMNGPALATPADDVLQSSFMSSMNWNHLNRSKARVGRNFLSQHSALLKRSNPLVSRQPIEPVIVLQPMELVDACINHECDRLTQRANSAWGSKSIIQGGGDSRMELQHLIQLIYFLSPDSKNFQLYEQQCTRIWAALYHAGFFTESFRFMQLIADAKHQIAESKGFNDRGVRYVTSYWVCNIGHFGLLGGYFKARQLGLLGDISIKLVLKNKTIANQALFSYFTPYFDQISKKYLPEEEDHEKYCNDLVFGFRLPDGSFVNQWVFYANTIAAWDNDKQPPLLTLKEHHKKAGRAALKSAGIPENAWFVCIHVRESGFKGDTKLDSIRNAHLASYESAVKLIASQGGWVIRLGDAKMPPMPSWPNSFDYALSKQKSDWMDVFLLASCQFFLGTASGPSEIPPCFGRPCALTNWPYLCITSPYSRDRFIAKHLKWSDCGTPFTIAERLSDPFAVIEYPSKISDIYRFEYQDNTPEEIAALVNEMLDEAFNPQNDGDYQARLEKYDALVAPYRRTGQYRGNAKPGHQFLRDVLKL